MFDVIIIGGGPAGMSAALVLARCCRKVVVFDDDRPRNYAARHLHSFLSRDGTAPEDLRRMGREELERYGVEFRHETVQRVERVALAADDAHRSTYRITLEDGERIEGRKVLLATGVRDQLPELNGFDTFYGRGVYHCPYCDAFEHRGQHFAAIGTGERGVELAVMLRQWSEYVSLCAEGESVSDEARERLTRNGVKLIEPRVAELEADEEQKEMLGWLRLDTGEKVPCQALFFVTGQGQGCGLGKDLGCACSEKEKIITNDWYGTNVYGCYCAGDAGGREVVEVQLIVQAVADGATAAIGLNQELAREDEAARVGQ